MNVPLDPEARSGLALSTGLGASALEAALGYDGKALLVAAPLLRGEGGMWHANLSVPAALSVLAAGQEGCRTLSSIFNVAPPDCLQATRLANIGSPEALVAALIELTWRFDLSLCCPARALTPTGTATSFWDEGQAANILVMLRDRDGEPLLDENGDPLYRRACEAAGLASAASRELLRQALLGTLLAELRASGKPLPIMPTLRNMTFCSTSLLAAAQQLDAFCCLMGITPAALYEAFYVPSLSSTQASRKKKFAKIMAERRRRSEACPRNPLNQDNWPSSLAYNRFKQLMRLRKAESPCPALSGQQPEAAVRFEWRRRLAAQVLAEQFCSDVCVLPAWTGEWVEVPASQVPCGRAWAYAPMPLLAAGDSEDDEADEAAAAAAHEQAVAEAAAVAAEEEEAAEAAMGE
ncbi:hypothetical protein COHA_010224 [Chlorella ohadii]|uniref:Uncharacterized protein n=1 Tax=Chlorella ohadii TaxID=2649997 RepID=A0AAD5DGS1_9CHLO|nr:hypothetical protein COHA_010224 [Chlorella ohadii]